MCSICYRGTGWFQQRDTVSLGFRWPMLNPSLFFPSIPWQAGTIFTTTAVHQIIQQVEYFC